MGEIRLTTSIVFIALFAIAIVGFLVGFASDNNSAISLNNDPSYSGLSTQVSNNLSQFAIETNTSSTSFYRSNVESGDTTLRSGSSFKVGLGSLYTSLDTVITGINQNIFGGSPAFAIFFTTFSALLVWIGFRYVLKTWIGGNPD